MSDCAFCKAPAQPHGIHGAEDFDMCADCRSTFVTLRWFTDPQQQKVLGFKCAHCGFECDVPGRVDHNAETNEFEIKVDSTHKYCQNCGTPTR